MQPNYQYPPQQAYAPAQQYQQPPQAQGAYVQQQYPPAPAYGQPAAAAPTPVTPPALGQTRGAGGGVSPKARHLVGRTIIIEPIRVDEDAKDQAGKPRPEAYFHLTVVDGGPLLYGDSQDNDPAKQRPMSFRVETPVRFTNCNDYGWGFVQDVRDALARGDMASVGVFERGTQGNRPYLVTKVGTQLDGSERPDGDARFMAATELWNRTFNKDTSWSNTPVSLVAPPAQAPQQVAYQQPAPMAQQLQSYPQPAYAPAPQQPGYNPAAYAQPAPQQPSYAPQPQGPYGEAAAYNPYTPVPQGTAAPQPSALAQAAAMDPGYAAWLASQQQAGVMPGTAPPQGPGI